MRLLIATLFAALPAHALVPGARPLHLARPCRAVSICSVASAEQTEDDDDALVSLDSISDEFMAQVEASLVDRNKERILSGLPKYESISAMVDAYEEFEAREKGMSRAEAESEVLRYLQRRALMSEGGFSSSDPQDVVTFVLLGALVLGVGYQAVLQGTGAA